MKGQFQRAGRPLTTRCCSRDVNERDKVSSWLEVGLMDWCCMCINVIWIYFTDNTERLEDKFSSTCRWRSRHGDITGSLPYFHMFIYTFKKVKQLTEKCSLFGIMSCVCVCVWVRVCVCVCVVKTIKKTQAFLKQLIQRNLKKCVIFLF